MKQQQKLQTNEPREKQEVGAQKSELELLKEEMTNLKHQLNEAEKNKLRTLADYQNLVKRVEREKQDWIKFSNEGLIFRLLEIMDNLERATVFVNDQGLQMVQTQFKQLLIEYGAKEIEILGKDFDPSIMECIDKCVGEKNKVIEVKAKGYMLHEKVLRPAKVVVGE